MVKAILPERHLPAAPRVGHNRYWDRIIQVLRLLNLCRRNSATLTHLSDDMIKVENVGPKGSKRM